MTTLYCTGQSLQFASNLSELRVGSGENAVLECVLIGSSERPPSFTWSGPAHSNGRTSIGQSASGTYSRLTINGVGSNDAGQYTCSYSGISSVSITLTVVGKLRHHITSFSVHRVTTLPI